MTTRTRKTALAPLLRARGFQPPRTGKPEARRCEGIRRRRARAPRTPAAVRARRFRQVRGAWASGAPEQSCPAAVRLEKNHRNPAPASGAASGREGNAESEMGVCRSSKLGIKALFLLLAPPLPDLIPRHAIKESVLVPDPEEAGWEPPLDRLPDDGAPTPAVGIAAALVVARVVNAVEQWAVRHAEKGSALTGNLTARAGE
jgi:hypothetical protein